MISDYHDTLGGLDKDFESTEIEDEYNLRNGLSFLNEDTAVQFIEKSESHQKLSQYPRW